MSKQISKSQFFEVAESACSTPRKLEQLKDVIQFIEDQFIEEERPCLDLAYTVAKTHHTVTASHVRSNGSRFKVFSAYENGEAMCQHRIRVPENVSGEQRMAIHDAYDAYRDATGGEAGPHWKWFSIESISLGVLTDAIREIADALHSTLD